MNRKNPEQYAEALAKLKEELRFKRGYGPRIAQRLKVKPKQVYSVLYGVTKDPDILRALVNEAKNTVTKAEESYDLLSSYMVPAA